MLRRSTCFRRVATSRARTRTIRPPLRSCLSTPLIAGKDLVGVLTVYSIHRDTFNEDHRRVVEVVARQVSETVKQSVAFRREQTELWRDQLTGLPNRQHLERFIASELAAAAGLPCSILLFGISHTNRSVARNPGSGLIAQVAAGIRAGLRGADLLFRYDSDAFVALLTQTDAVTADTLGRRALSELSNIRLGDDSLVDIATLRIGRATAPEDGSTLADLVRVAENRPIPPSSANRHSVH